MEMLRDLIRDLVGIIFPGALIVILTLWFFFSIIIILIPSSLLNILTIGGSTIGLFALLVFSYLAGQILRLKGLDRLEKECTNEYRKRHKSTLSNEEFDESIKNINEEEERYYSGQSILDNLKKMYELHFKRFGFWEEFPYPYYLKGERLVLGTTNYNKFFENYDRQGITKYRPFINFCRMVIYEYSPSLKEEILRQESLVRLFAGIYYMIRYGKIVGLTSGILHLFMIISSYQNRIGFISYSNLEFSYEIVVISVFAYFIFRYLNKEILSRLRFMRDKEVRLAYEGFYLVSKKLNLDL